MAKHVFQVHGVDASGATVLRKQLRRNQVVAFFAALPRCVVGLEACATAHYWARELQAVGHEVRLMPAQYVKAYVKRNKNDAADAEAICEAVGRPSMRFVALKTAEQQAALLLHRGRERLVLQRSTLVNALRAHLAEFGVIAPQGLRNVARLIAIVRDDSDTRLPDLARRVLEVLASQLEQLIAAVVAIEQQLTAWHRNNPVSQRLGSARSSPRRWPRRLSSRSGLPAVANLRRGWVWCRGSIRPAAKRGLAASPSAATATCGVW